MCAEGNEINCKTCNHQNLKFIFSQLNHVVFSVPETFTLYTHIHSTDTIYTHLKLQWAVICKNSLNRDALSTMCIGFYIYSDSISCTYSSSDNTTSAHSSCLSELVYSIEANTIAAVISSHKQLWTLSTSYLLYCSLFHVSLSICIRVLVKFTDSICEDVRYKSWTAVELLMYDQDCCTVNVGPMLLNC